MSIAVDTVAVKKVSVVAGVALPVAYPLFDKTHLVVLYGVAGLTATLDTDYTVDLNVPTYADFTLTPTAALLVKINALIAAAPTTEANQLVIRRVVPYLEDLTPENVFIRQKISNVIDLAYMAMQQLADKARRAIKIRETEVSTVDYQADAPEAGKSLKWDGTLGRYVNTTADLDELIATAEAARDAAIAAQAAADADVLTTHADVVLTHADVVLTHADVVLTHADVVLTHADAVATAADRVVVAADKATVIADMATTLGYKNAATAAQTGAETAQGLSEDARDDSQAAQTAAETAQTLAGLAQAAAEAARDATLAAYDNFDDRYLGPKSSAPTLDNDGNALVGGALYYDTVLVAMQLWTGSSWVAAYVSGSGFLATTNALQELVDAGLAATAFGKIKQAATTSATGVVELATDAEVQTGTDTVRAVVPSSLAAWLTAKLGTAIQAYNANLAALAGLTLAADKMLYATGAGALALLTTTSYGRALLGLADQAALQTAVGLSSPVVQQVRTSTSARQVITTSIPLDDTIPQSSEGAQIMSLAITPTSATSVLEVEALVYCSEGTSGADCALALFRDAGTDAIAAVAMEIVGGDNGNPYSLRWHVTSGSTSATTFKLRGGTAQGSLIINGLGFNRQFGGVAATSMVITEWKA